jgi:hypothetical protein
MHIIGRHIRKGGNQMQYTFEEKKEQVLKNLDIIGSIARMYEKRISKGISLGNIQKHLEHLECVWRDNQEVKNFLNFLKEKTKENLCENTD